MIKEMVNETEGKLRPSVHITKNERRKTNDQVIALGLEEGNGSFDQSGSTVIH